MIVRNDALQSKELSRSSTIPLRDFTQIKMTKGIILNTIIRLRVRNFWMKLSFSFDILTSKFQDDINLLMTTSKFWSIYMNKIDKNIDLINKML